MAEVEADSAGTTTDASENDFDLGSDLSTDITSEPTTVDSTSSPDAGTTGFDPNAVDFGTADPETLPPPYREAQTWAKNREKELQGDYTRKTQELADYRRQVEGLQASLAQNQQIAANAAAATAPPAPDPLQDLRMRLGEDSGAVDIVSDIVKANIGNAVESNASKLSQLEQAVTTMAQHMVGNSTAGINQQVAEAREAYGADLDNYAGQIKALISVPNPATNEAYTVKEAFELVSGKAAVKSQELAAGERQVRSDASQRTALPGVVGAANADDGELTPSQLTAGLKQLGFE